jgi:hypothetical protein
MYIHSSDGGFAKTRSVADSSIPEVNELWNYSLRHGFSMSAIVEGHNSNEDRRTKRNLSKGVRIDV